MMQKYDSYKDSGIQWLGEIPSHWGVVRTKNISHLYTGNSLNEKAKEKYSSPCEDAYPYISSKDVSLETEDVNYDNGLRVPKTNNRFEIAPANSFLLCIEGGSAGRKRAFLDKEVCFVNKLCCFNSTIHSKFHYYTTQGFYFNSKFKSCMQGLIGGVSVSAIKDFYVALPPYNEQEAIANYLDTATAKIDTAIAQQQKMIDLLNERKQIIINRAVTKGLNPNVKMKDSGVEWIGEVPEHWEVKPIKRCCEFVRTKANRPHSYRVALENIQSWTGQYIQTDSVFDGLGILFKKGDVLFGKLRPYLAKVFLADQDGEALGDFWVFRPKTEILSNYLQIILLSYRVVNLIDSTTYGTKMPRADWGLNSHLMIPIPPIDSQNEIIKSIHTDCAQIDASINNFKKTIDLLRERKQIIINDVVTGKVKII